MENTETTETETPIPDIVRETIQAQHKFSDPEKLKLNERLIQSMDAQDQIDREFDSVKQEFKSRIEKAQLETDVLRGKLRDGFEMRATRAIVSFNTPEHGRKTFVREDTGEIIRDEAMSHADFNRPLFRNGDGKDATEPEPADTILAQHEADFENTHEGEGTKDDLEVDPTAAKTNLGEALDSAAIKTDQPQILLGGFGLDDWNQKGLTKAFVVAATAAGWSKPAISAMRAQILALDNVAAIKDLLRPFVIVEGPSFESLMKDAMDSFTDTGKMKALFAQVVSLYPAKYPGGNHEANFGRFENDVAAAIEREIAESQAEAK